MALASDLQQVRLTAAIDSPEALARLLDEKDVDVVLSEASADIDFTVWLSDHRKPFVVLIDDRDSDRSVDALDAGAVAVLPRATLAAEVTLAITAAARGLSRSTSVYELAASSVSLRRS